MDSILIMTGVFLILGSVFFAAISDNPIRAITLIFSFFGLFLFGFGISISVKNETNKTRIPAIEVYRGNTTLQITYQDSVAIDSIVVYKNNYI